MGKLEKAASIRKTKKKRWPLRQLLHNASGTITCSNQWTHPVPGVITDSICRIT
jgi:hypothetical protein